jgi:hypothetical protein
MNERLASAHLGKRGWRVMQRHAAKAVPFYQPQHPKLGVANSRRVCQDGIEDRLQICRRTRNNAQHLGRRSLLFQRLVAFVAETGEDRFLTGNGNTAIALGLWRIAVLWRGPLAA